MNKSQLKRPDQIKSFLDKHVVGQEEAKKTLSIAVYNHYKRILHLDDPERTVDVEKGNVLLIGPSGTGKTLMIKKLAKYLGVPFYIGNASSLSATGYAGADVESLLQGLLMACGNDVAKASTGIVFIDEIDKIATRTNGTSNFRDVNGQDVQNALLKMIEGHEVGVMTQGPRKHPMEPLVYLNTDQILFICSGAFTGLPDIVARRTGKDRSRIGFGSQTSDAGRNVLADVMPVDLVAYGMSQEFTGRLPVITYTEPLDEKDLERILTEPKDSLVSQYQELFREDGVSLSFTQEALAAIAHRANVLGTGARGLRTVMESAMRETMFNLPRKVAWKTLREIEITPEMISPGYDDCKEIKNAG